MFDRLTAERDGSWVLTALRRRWWVIVLITIIGGAAAYAYAAHQPKKYTASSAVLFSSTHLDQELVGHQIVAAVDPTREAATNQALVELPTVARLVAAQLHISSAQVLSDVAFGSDSQSDVLGVSATDPSPTRAAAIANAYVQGYIQFRKQAAQSQLITAAQLVRSKLAQIPLSQRNGTIGTQLATELNQLDLLTVAQTGDAQQVETATVPHSPSYPTPKKQGILGALLGLLVGLGLVTILERRDRSIKTLEEVEAIYDMPVIGTVPESSSVRQSGLASPRDEEAFLMIRAQLRYFDVDRNVQRVMVTSAESGEGKSVIALNLARAAARTDDMRSLLIECDMRRPSLAHRIGRGAEAGLSELLSHSQDLATGLRELVVAPEDEFASDRPIALDVLLAGRVPPNPLELLESSRMRELLDVADAMYDVVILDTPPIGMISDAIPLVHRVDGLLVITRVGVTRRDAAVRLMKRIRGLNANLLGVVVNSYRAPEQGYYNYQPQEPRVSPLRGRKARQRSTRSR